MTDPDALVDLIRDSVIGDDEAVAGPFGIRRVTYADYTASGRALSFIEDYLRDAVLPLYANTHTESSGTGLQTTRFREEARRIIRDAVGGSDDHAVIFCGSGMTARDQQARRRPQPAHPERPRRPLLAALAHPARRAPAGLHRAVRAPQQRAAVARVDRRRRDDRRGRRRAHRPRASRARARGDRGPPAPDRLLLRGVERHRASSPTPARSPSCSTATARSRSGTSRPPGRTSTSR